MRMLRCNLIKTKKCSTCKKKLPANKEVFTVKSASKDGLGSLCRVCKSDYSRSRKSMQSEVDRINRNSKNALDRNIAWYASYLSSQRCVDCGEDDPIVLELDHIRDKTENVYKLVHSKRSIKVIQAEIDKCEVRCGNCHRRNTSRKNYKNGSGILRRERELVRINDKGLSTLLTSTASSLKEAYVYKVRYASSCIDCQESDGRVLDFDHIRGKKVKAISTMHRGTKFTLLDIIHELEKCDVRCVNCHKQRHFLERN